MGKTKSKKKKWLKNLDDEPKDIKVPIENLPEKFLWMHVKSGTKIRNVLGYALKEFPKYNSVVWSAAGQGIEKAVSCAEIFKGKHEALHQVTKLRYIRSEKSKEGSESDSALESRYVPEIHILLAKDVKDRTVLGYQAPGDIGEFAKDQDTEALEQTARREGNSNASCIDAAEFAAMGLRTGQKRPKREHQTDAPSKKNRK